MKIKKLLKRTRERYGETQEQFAKRFDTTANTISRWETGAYEVPNRVIESIFGESLKEIDCVACNGTGKILVPYLP